MNIIGEVLYHGWYSVDTCLSDSKERHYMLAQRSTWQIFRLSLVVTLVFMAGGFAYQGNWDGAIITIMLGLLELSLSFDNAVVNATILEHMDDKWQKRFLTWGFLIAVVGMRLVFPFAIIWVTAGLNPYAAFNLALNPPIDGASHFLDGSASYATLLHDAHPAIGGFGGAFLAMLTFTFFLNHREAMWLTWVERPLSKVGKFNDLPFMQKLEHLHVVPTVLTLVSIVCAAEFVAEPDKAYTVLLSGVLGVLLFLGIKFLGEKFSPEGHVEGVTKLVGRAAFMSFLYLEVLDASFSFDGVIGAFAITSDPILIALGLGIGAMFIRSLTIYFVARGTLKSFPYLESGAFWAIGSLAAIMLMTVGHIEVSELITGSVSAGLIGLAFVASVIYKKRHPEESFDIVRESHEPELVAE